MTKQIRRNLRSYVDPFDIDWTEIDPLGREVMMLKPIEQARESMGKHPVPPEFLSTQDVRVVIPDPDRIDESVQRADRDIYYKIEEQEDYQYSRAIVDFRDDPHKGTVISWSRYEKPVSSYGIKYQKED